MQKLSEKFPLPERKSLDVAGIQDTCTPIFLQSTSEQEDCTVAKVRSLRCLFSPCPGTMSPIQFLTSPDTLPRGRSTLIEDCTGKESTHRSTLRPLSRD